LRVARKERLELRRDGRARLGLAVLLVMVIGALAAGLAAQHDTETRRALAERRDRAAWLAQGRHNPHSAAHFGRYLFRPVSPLSFIDAGVEAQLGVAQRVEAHFQTPPRGRPAEFGTILARFGEGTAASVLQVFVPFLVILLLASAFSAEREAGTERLLLSLGVPWRGVALGKALGVAHVAVAPLALVALLGAGALLVAQGAEGRWWELAVRLVLMAGAYLAYFGAFAFLSLAVSARARSSGTALVWLLAFWFFGTLVLPRLAAEAAERVYPVPGMQDFKRDVMHNFSEEIDGHNPAGQRAEALKQQVLQQYRVSRVEDLPVSFDGLMLQAGEDYGDRVLDRHFGRLWSQYDGQATLRAIFSVVAPVLAVREWSMIMAGTDLDTHRTFWNQAEAFRRAFVAFLNGYLTAHGPNGDWTWKADGSLWVDAPQFTWKPPSLAERLGQGSRHLAVLCAWLVACAALAMAAPPKIGT
jgi:ABC-2 type transport system permease protein